MDLLAILPYYIEIALQKDTVSPSRLNLMIISSDVCFLPQSTLFRFSILRTFRLLRVFRPFRYNNTLLLCVYLLASLSRLLILVLAIFHLERERSTIEVMYLSFRRSKDALLALGFFVLMVVIVFSTLLYVFTFPPHVALIHVDHIKVLY
jgi:potassium voltage-gated channel Shal-related subfamily D member 2